MVGRGERHGPELATAFRWLSALIALPTVAYAGQPFFLSALGALKGRRLNMDVPISLAIILATGMSLYQTMRGSEQVYFDAAVSLLFFLLVGRFLDETLARACAGRGAKSAQPAKRHRHNHRARRHARPSAGACALPGRSAPGRDRRAGRRRRRGAGGEGTGRSKPDHRRDGAAHRAGVAHEIYAGTLNLTGPLEIEVRAADSATLLAEISRLMLAAEQGKARYRRLADRAAAIYAPAVHGLGLATFLGWLLIGASWQTALTYAIAVLIITCPCALALAVPAVQIAAASRLFRRRIIVKTADGLERIADTDMVVFDKTGTLTFGRPELIHDDRISDAYAGGCRRARRRKQPPLRSRNRCRGGEAVGARGAGARRGGAFQAAVSGALSPRVRNDLGRPSGAGSSSEGEDSEVWYRRDWMVPVCFRFDDSMQKRRGRSGRRAEAARLSACLAFRRPQGGG